MNDSASQMSSGLASAWAATLVFLPKFVMFALVLVAGYFLAKFVAKGFDGLLERLKFDRLVERGGLKQSLAKTGLHASGLLSKLLFYGLFLFVLQFAFGIFGPNPVSNLLTQVIAYIPNVVVAVIVVILAMAVARGVRDILAASLGTMRFGPVLARASAVAIVAVGAFAALDQLGIAPAVVRGLFYAVLAAVAGTAIIALGGGGIQPMRRLWERTLDHVEHQGSGHARSQSAEKMTSASEAKAEAVSLQHRHEGMTTPYPSSPSPEQREQHVHDQ